MTERRVELRGVRMITKTDEVCPVCKGTIVTDCRGKWCGDCGHVLPKRRKKA